MNQALLKEQYEEKEDNIFKLGGADVMQTSETVNTASLIPLDLREAIDKINSIDTARLNNAISKIESLDIDRLNNAINQLPVQKESSGFLGMLGGNMQTWLILLIAGVVIYFMFFKDK